MKNLKSNVCFTVLALFTLGLFSGSRAQASFSMPIVICDPIQVSGAATSITINADAAEVYPDDAVSEKAMAIITQKADLQTRFVSAVSGDFIEATLTSNEQFTSQNDNTVHLKVVNTNDGKYNWHVTYETKNGKGVWKTLYDGDVRCTTRQYESIGGHN